MIKTLLKVTAVVVILLSGCHREGSQSHIFFDLLQKSKKQNVLEIREVVHGDWDRACFFSSGLPKYEVEKILDIKLPGTDEFVERLIFFEHGTLVLYDEVSYLPLDPNEQIAFEYDRTIDSGYFCFTSDESRFEIHQQCIDGRAFYTLKLEK